MAANQSGSTIGNAVKRGFAIQGKKTSASSRTPARVVSNRTASDPF